MIDTSLNYIKSRLNTYLCSMSIHDEDERVVELSSFDDGSDSRNSQNTDKVLMQLIRVEKVTTPYFD